MTERPACFEIDPRARGQATPGCGSRRLLVPAIFRIDPLFTMSDSTRRARPIGTEPSGTADAKGFSRTSTDPSGGARRDRTDDLLLAKQALSQLSYGPVRGQRSDDRGQKCVRSASVICHLTSVIRKLVGLGRFELPTSRLSSARSNQLSYKPTIRIRRPAALDGGASSSV